MNAAGEHNGFSVHVTGSVDEQIPIAVFMYPDQAQWWAEKNYPSRGYVKPYKFYEANTLKSRSVFTCQDCGDDYVHPLRCRECMGKRITRK